jgi:hypothetical protein
MGDIKGTRGSDTVDFDDLALLGALPTKITHIKMWADPASVGGLQVTYLVGGMPRQAPQHVGSQGWNMPTQELALGPDEFVTEITGSHSTLIQNLVFKTNQGKVLSGGGMGPQAFTLTIPGGQQAVALRGGANGYLQTIGCSCGPLVPGAGLGPQALPLGPPVSPPPPSLFPFAASVQFTPEVGGKLHPDSRRFDMGNDAAKGGQLMKVSMLHNGKQIYGLACTYFFNQKKAKSGYVGRLKNLKNPTMQKVTLSLQPGEQIIEVSGRAGDLLNNLTLRTNSGRLVTAGSFVGDPFPNILPPGRQLVTFHGLYGECLHKIGLYFR